MTATLEPAHIEAAAIGARQELGRRHLLDFAALTYPGFQAPPHIQYIAGLLERMEAGGIKRLAISAPPGHGKSCLLQAFVAWFLGRGARRRVLTMSASESLAKRNSRDTQLLVTGEAWPWPATRLINDSILEWRTNQGSEVRAIGKGGTCVGFRCDGAVVDDLQADAGSETTRATDFGWFQAELTTRLEPDAWAVILGTRWGDSDIIGQLKEGESADQWTFVNLPAIAGDDDILGRAEGEALWPQRWPIEKLIAKKAEVGSSVFGALYMGDPIASGGATFKAEWFEQRYDKLPPYALTTIQSVDSAWKTGSQNDRSVIATLATDWKDIWVVDVWAGRVAYSDLQRITIENYYKHRPRVLYVEEASSGFALVDSLRRGTGIPIKGISPGRDSKEARAEAVTGLFEAGRVKFPKDASWMHELLGEFLRFPHGKHDDIVDAVVLGVSQLRDSIVQRENWKRFQSQHWTLQR